MHYSHYFYVTIQTRALNVAPSSSWNVKIGYCDAFQRYDAKYFSFPKKLCQAVGVTLQKNVVHFGWVHKHSLKELFDPYDMSVEDIIAMKDRALDDTAFRRKIARDQRNTYFESRRMLGGNMRF